MELSPEIRNNIYELALEEPHGLAAVTRYKGQRRTIIRGVLSEYEGKPYIFSKYKFERQGHSVHPSVGPDDVPWSQLTPNLLAVSKQVKAEAAGYLYKQSIAFEDMMALHSFLAGIGQTNRDIVSNIIVKDWANGNGAHKTMNTTGMTLLAFCPNIQEIRFDCKIHLTNDAGRSAAQLYRDGHHFFEAYGDAAGKKDAGVGVINLNAFESEDIEGEKETFRADLKKLLGC